MNISVIILILSYMGISITNKEIVNYKYDTVFDKMIKQMLENGYTITNENKKKFIAYLINNYNEEMRYIYGDYFSDYNQFDELKIGENFTSFFPCLNIISFLKNIEFMIDKKLFDYRCLALIKRETILEELQRSKIINEGVEAKKYSLSPGEDKK
ncbi:MAG: hypothetical protein J6J17_01715 [Bacilli bacterium]|nr:hypothetical protein [Bacilli bacterium]